MPPLPDGIPLDPYAAVLLAAAGTAGWPYLAYGIVEAPQLASDWMWSTVVFTVVASVAIHGVLATPLMRRIVESEEPG